jgi:PKD repeat protein
MPHGDNVFTHNLPYTVGGPDAEVSRFDYPGDNPGVFNIPPNLANQNPLFVDPDNLDFRLQASSPARGAGLSGEDLGAIPYEVGGNPPPVASFTATPTSGTAPLSVSVDGSGSSDDGSIAAWAWSWGDGTPNGSGETASHTYTTAGTYTLTLTVTDNLGATDTATATITVSEAESPTIPALAITGGKFLVFQNKFVHL